MYLSLYLSNIYINISYSSIHPTIYLPIYSFEDVKKVFLTCTTITFRYRDIEIDRGIDTDIDRNIDIDKVINRDSYIIKETSDSNDRSIDRSKDRESSNDSNNKVSIYLSIYFFLITLFIYL
jgi:hypothetical protein